MLKLLGRLWRKWLRLAEVIGNFNLGLLLSIIYWTFFTLVAIPFKLLADPLGFRSKNRGGWTVLRPTINIMEEMKRQG
jgi:hypothetical protein